MKLNSRTRALQMESLVKQKFALLAKVGVQKRKALAYQEAEEFYFTIATEALAGFAELLEFLQEAEKVQPQLKEYVATHTSKFHNLMRTLLTFWPKSSDSQERLLSLLDSDGLANFLTTTDEGYVSLSTDQILENVARVIEATKKE